MFDTATKINDYANKHIKGLPNFVRLPLKLIIYLTVFGLALVCVFLIGMFKGSSKEPKNDTSVNPMEKYVSTDRKHINDPTNIFWNDD